MNTSADLHRAVQAALAGGRLGTRVFVRYLLYADWEPPLIIPTLASLVGIVTQWLGQSLDQAYAAGSPEQGQLSLTLRFQRGATGLVCFARREEPGTEITVLGNQGAIFHESAPGYLLDQACPEFDPVDTAAIAAAIERSLATGHPETLFQGGRP